MQDTIDSLLTHIKTKYTDSTFQTVDLVADEFDSKGEVRRTIKLPALIGTVPEARISGQESNMSVLLYVITESLSLRKKQSGRNNLEASSALVRWLVKNRMFQGLDRCYRINMPINVQVWDITPRHCIVRIGLEIIEQ